MESVAWYETEPDQEQAVVTSGYDSGTNFVSVLRSRQKNLAIAYLPQQRTITIDLGWFTSPVQGQWFDPTSGAYIPIKNLELKNRDKVALSSPPINDAGKEDFVLILSTEVPSLVYYEPLSKNLFESDNFLKNPRENVTILTINYSPLAH